MAELVPLAMIAFDGKFAPAGPMLQFETVSLSLPVVVPVLKITVPAMVASVEVDEPRMVVLVTVLFEASAMKRIVPDPVVVPIVVLESVSELPPVFKPLIVTLSAPFRSINGLPAAIAPEMVRAAPPAGEIVMEVLAAFAFKLAETVSVVFPQTSIVITPKWIVPVLMAENASESVAYAVGTPAAVPPLDSTSIGPAVSHVPAVKSRSADLPNLVPLSKPKPRAWPAPEAEAGGAPFVRGTVGEPAALVRVIGLATRANIATTVKTTQNAKRGDAFMKRKKLIGCVLALVGLVVFIALLGVK
jgi:hypothetical protein